MVWLFWECLEREQREHGIREGITSPFTSDIEMVTPREWKISSMEPYRGTSDSIVHLQSIQHMLMSRAVERVLCKCFLLFLLGLAATSFCRLSQVSISSWEMLKEKFLSQFHIYVKQPKDANSFSNIKQKADESVQ